MLVPVLFFFLNRRRDNNNKKKVIKVGSVVYLYDPASSSVPEMACYICHRGGCVCVCV